MKIELEIPDIEEVIYSEYESECINGKDIKEAFVDLALEKMIDKLYYDYIGDRIHDSIQYKVSEFVKEHQKEIIERIVDGVSNEIIRKKSITDQMPKKSEVAGISKEWENYFIELIDKAIAKRFK